MAPRSRRIVLLANRALVLVQRREGVYVHTEDVFLDVVRERFELVRSVDVCRDGEDCQMRIGVSFVRTRQEGDIRTNLGRVLLARAPSSRVRTRG